MKKMNKWERLILETYQELYANCTTPVDFDLLAASAEIDESGCKIIPFEKYFIEQKKMDEIIENKIKKARMRKADRGVFRATIYLGCSPTTIQEQDRNE